MAIIITEVAIQDDATFAVEIYNSGTSDVDISDWSIGVQLPPASILGVPIPLGIVLEPGEFYTVGHSSIPGLNQSNADQTFNQSFFGSVSPPSVPLIFVGPSSNLVDATDTFGLLDGPVFGLDVVYQGSLTRTPDPDETNNNISDFTSTMPFSTNTLGAPCFLEGTLISTPEGVKAIETMAHGDLVLTSDGRAVPVKWLGRRSFAPWRAKEGRALVRISAGALGNGLPRRDLFVTGDHGMILGGFVVNAGALVKAVGVRWEPVAQLPREITVYHIETEDHDVILAEGAEAESFIDYAGRHAFDNHEEYLVLCGTERVIPEMTMSRVTKANQLPNSVQDRITMEAATPRQKTA